MIGFCSIALRKLPIEEAIDRIVAGGFREIEIWHAHVQEKTDEELARLAALRAERGLTFTVLSPYLTFTRGPERVFESLKTAEKVLSSAKILGIKKIRTFVDIGPDGLPSAKADESAWKAAISGLRELCAMDPAVEFVVETHKNTLADTLPSVKRLLEETGKPNLKLNFQANEDFLSRGLFSCLEELWTHVSHMHWQQIFPDDGEGYIEEAGLIDFTRLVRVLLERNYQGTASVEYCWLDADPARIGTAWQFLTRVGSNSL